MLPDLPLEASVEGTILASARERLLALKLPGIEDRVYNRKQAYDTNLEPPYVLVTLPPEGTPWPEGTNEKDVCNFAIMIAIVLANQRDLTAYMGTQLVWRQTIRRKFQCKSNAAWDLNTAFGTNFPGTFFIFSQVESGDKFIEAAWREQRDASYYLVRLMVKEPRE